MISTKQQQAWKLRPTLKKDKETTRTNSQRGCMICGPPFNLNLQQCPWSPDYYSKEGKLTEAMFHMWTDIKNKNQRQRRERENLFPAPFVNSPSGLTTQVRGESKHQDVMIICTLFVILWETSLLQNVCVCGCTVMLSQVEPSDWHPSVPKRQHLVIVLRVLFK